jgi:tetratricopeptide (TPR) repeat protein
MVRVRANHFALVDQQTVSKVNPTSSKNQTPVVRGRSGARGWLVGLGILVLVVLGLGIGRGWLPSRTPPPIPAPSQLGSLDPQVRAHLIALAKQAAASPFEGSRRSELGLALAVNGLWGEARGCFLDAIQLGDAGPLPRMYAAVALQETGDAPGAVKELEHVVERFPDAAAAWYRLGVARVAAGELIAAEAAFAKVADLKPTEWRGWAGVGEARVRQGRHAEAIEPLERAVRLDPYARSAYHLLGQAFRALGLSEKAATALAAGGSQTVGPMADDWSVRALDHMRLLPDQFERCDALLAQNQFGEAIHQLRQAQSYHPTNVSVIVRLARALSAAGDPASAAGVLDEARRTMPDDVGLLTASAEIVAAMGNGSEALTLARRAVGLAPQLPEAHVAEANAWLASDDDTSAVLALERALERAPGNVGLLLQLGDLEWHNLQRREAAWSRYVQAQAVDPIHPATLERLVSLAIEQGDFDAAESHLTEFKRLRMQVDLGGVQELEMALRRARATP